MAPTRHTGRRQTSARPTPRGREVIVASVIERPPHFPRPEWRKENVRLRQQLDHFFNERREPVERVVIVVESRYMSVGAMAVERLDRVVERLFDAAGNLRGDHDIRGGAALLRQPPPRGCVWCLDGLTVLPLRAVDRYDATRDELRAHREAWETERMHAEAEEKARVREAWAADARSPARPAGAVRRWSSRKPPRAYPPVEHTTRRGVAR